MNNHTDGIRFCLYLIEEMRQEYAKKGYDAYDLSINQVLEDVENEIGYRAHINWPERKNS